MRLTGRQIVTVIALLAVFMMLAACRERGETGATAKTETIAPAAPQPAANGTDAMTQTVDVETGRSEAEGGGVGTTAPVPPSATDTATAPVPAPTTTTR